MKRTRRIFVVSAISIAFVLGACAGRPSQGVLVPMATVEGTSLVPIFAATTRQRSTTDPGEMFSGQRAVDVSYAAITVSIPPDASRKIGEVQWPASLPGDPHLNFTTVSAGYIDKPTFAASIAAYAKRTGRTKVLVFVHGFNNTFEYGIMKTAQLAGDLGLVDCDGMFDCSGSACVFIRRGI